MANAVNPKTLTAFWEGCIDRLNAVIEHTGTPQDKKCVHDQFVSVYKDSDGHAIGSFRCLFQLGAHLRSGSLGWHNSRRESLILYSKRAAEIHRLDPKANCNWMDEASSFYPLLRESGMLRLHPGMNESHHWWATVVERFLLFNPHFWPHPDHLFITLGSGPFLGPRRCSAFDNRAFVTGTIGELIDTLNQSVELLAKDVPWRRVDDDKLIRSKHWQQPNHENLALGTA